VLDRAGRIRFEGNVLDEVLRQALVVKGTGAAKRTD
jgi:hypothetical protein